MRKRLSVIAGTILAAFAPVTVFAQAANCDTTKYKPLGGLLTGVSAECGACGQCQVADFFIVGNTVIELLLGLSGSVMLIMIVYGGFLWLTSGGNSSQIDKGKKVLVGAFIGLVIVFVAYTAVEFILAALGVPNVAEVFQRPFQTGVKK